MKKEKGLIIAVMAFFLVSGVAACIFRQYRDGQENGPAPVYVNQDRDLQPQATEKPEEQPEEEQTKEEQQEAESVQPETEQPEPSDSGADAGETEEKTVYYAFTVRRDISSLNLRTVPGMDGKILGRLMPEQTGYVLEHGEEWSLVTTGKKSGYVNNRYIEMEEIPEEDFPVEYRD